MRTTRPTKENFPEPNSVKKRRPSINIPPEKSNIVIPYHQPGIPPPGTAVYERLTIYLPYRELFQLIREGKIDIARARFIESENHCSMATPEIEHTLTQIEHKAVVEDYKAHTEAKKEIESQYGKNYLWIKDPPLPFHHPWMIPTKGQKTKTERLKAEKLMEHLGKGTRFFDVYNYLYSKIKGGEENLFPGICIVKGIERNYAIIKANEDFYNKAVNKLSIGQKTITESTIRAYIKGFCELNILKHLQAGGRGREPLYAIGYWVDYQYGSYRVVRFLTKDNPGIDKLLEFSL